MEMSNVTLISEAMRKAELEAAAAKAERELLDYVFAARDTTRPHFKRLRYLAWARRFDTLELA